MNRFTAYIGAGRLRSRRRANKVVLGISPVQDAERHLGRITPGNSGRYYRRHPGREANSTGGCKPIVGVRRGRGEIS